MTPTPQQPSWAWPSLKAIEQGIQERRTAGQEARRQMEVHSQAARDVLYGYGMQDGLDSRVVPQW